MFLRRKKTQPYYILRAQIPSISFIPHTFQLPMSPLQSYQIENVLVNLKTTWIRCDKAVGYP